MTTTTRRMSPEDEDENRRRRIAADGETVRVSIFAMDDDTQIRVREMEAARRPTFSDGRGRRLPAYTADEARRIQDARDAADRRLSERWKNPPPLAPEQIAATDATPRAPGPATGDAMRAIYAARDRALEQRWRNPR